MLIKQLKMTYGPPHLLPKQQCQRHFTLFKNHIKSKQADMHNIVSTWYKQCLLSSQKDLYTDSGKDTPKSQMVTTSIDPNTRPFCNNPKIDLVHIIISAFPIYKQL